MNEKEIREAQRMYSQGWYDCYKAIHSYINREMKRLDEKIKEVEGVKKHGE